MLRITIPEIKVVAKLALPLMAAFLAQKGMQLIDTIMLGWISPEAIAAGALAMVTFFTIIVFCMGTLSAVGVFAAHARGADTPAGVSAALHNGIAIALLLALPGMIIVWFLPKLLLAAGQAPVLVHNSRLLLHSLVWGMPGFLLFLVMREFISVFGLTRVVMLINFASLPLTLVANYVLIYGKLGLPALGIQGIGVASAGVMWFMFLAAFFYSKIHPRLGAHMQSWTLSHLSTAKVKEMLRVGIPSGVLFILDMGMFMAAVLMVGHFGADALAAYQIVMQCASVAFTISMALSMSIALLVSQSIGSNNLALARRYAGFGYLGVCIISSIIALLFVLIPNSFVGLFLWSNAPGINAVRERAMTFLVIAAYFVCFDAILIMASSILKGFKDTFIPMLLSVGGYWILGIGSAYFFAFHTSFAAVGIWYGLTLGIFSVALLLTGRCIQRFRLAQQRLDVQLPLLSL